MESNIAYLLAPFFGWLIAQIVKIVINRTTKKEGGFSKYFSSGEMPSAHTATVMALLTVLFITEGFSPLFAVAATFGAVTVYDALVARRSIGEQGVALVKLLGKSPFSKDPLPRVALGHRPLEVIVGGGIGIAVGLTVAFFITI